MDCIFCKIVKGEIKSDFLYSDETVFAIRDVSPQAPVHVLIMPKEHIGTFNDLYGKLDLLQKMGEAALSLSKKLKIDQSGYRTVINCNREGGQSVFHLHMHLLGGRQLGGSMVG